MCPKFLKESIKEFEECGPFSTPLPINPISLSHTGLSHGEDKSLPCLDWNVGSRVVEEFKSCGMWWW